MMSLMMGTSLQQQLSAVPLVLHGEKALAGGNVEPLVDNQ